MLLLLSVLGLLGAMAGGRASAQVVVEPDRNVPTDLGFPWYEGRHPVVVSSGGRSVLIRELGGQRLSRSDDQGATWTQFQVFSYPPSFREGDYVAAADTSGTFYLLWREAVTIVGRTLLLDRLSFTGDSPVWAPERRIVPGDDDLIQPAIACDSRQRSLYVAYVWKLGPQVPNQSDVWFLRSGDLGDTWSAPVNLSGPGCDRPQVVVGPDGEVYVLWVDAAAGLVRGRRSDDHGQTFAPPFVVGSIADNHATAPYEYFSTRFEHDVNYVYTEKYPNLLRAAVDRSTGPDRGRLYAAWTDHADGVVGPPLTSRIESEPNNSLATAQLCEIGDDIGGFIASADCIGCDQGDVWKFYGQAGQTLQLTGAVSFSPPNLDRYPDRSTIFVSCSTGVATAGLLAKAEYAEVGYPMAPMIVTLPRTGTYYLPFGNGGPRTKSYFVSLRAWTPTPGSVARDQRDIVLASSGDGGQTWQKVRVNDAPPQYDESLPELVVDGEGIVHVTWLDRRDAPLGYGERTDTYWAYSFNGARTFAPGTRLSSGSSSWQSYYTVDQITGKHSALAVLGPWVAAFWVDNRNPAVDQNGEYPGLWTTRARVEAVVSVAIPRFEAVAAAGGVRLQWTVRDARGISGFRLHRAVAGSEAYAPLAVEAQPPRGEGDYEQVDGRVVPGESYRYKLEVLRGGGASTWEGPVEFTMPGAPAALAWTRAWPNPTESSTQVTLSVPRTGPAEVSVYDVTGQRVARLHAGELTAGAHTWRWPSAGARRTAPGVYLLRAEVGGAVASGRIVVVR